MERTRNRRHGLHVVSAAIVLTMVCASGARADKTPGVIGTAVLEGVGSFPVYTFDLDSSRPDERLRGSIAFLLEKPIDEASNGLFSMSLSGAHAPSLKLDILQTAADGTTTLVASYAFYDVLIQRDVQACEFSKAPPCVLIEKVVIVARRIERTSANGHKTGWDLEQNKKI